MATLNASMPSPMPMFICTVRVNRSTFSPWPACTPGESMASRAARTPFSYSIARAVWGAANIRANPKASTPAAAPANRPRQMICFSILLVTFGFGITRKHQQSGQTGGRVDRIGPYEASSNGSSILCATRRRHTSASRMRAPVDPATSGCY